MLLADAAFVCSHPLDSHAMKAQARRTRSLKNAASFLSLVRHLKDRAPLKATIAALRNPGALHLLKMPVAVRVRRFAARFQSREGGRPDQLAAEQTFRD
jgi:succinoglycan biosynthesis protein ExoO